MTAAEALIHSLTTEERHDLRAGLLRIERRRLRSDAVTVGALLVDYLRGLNLQDEAQQVSDITRRLMQEAA